MLRQGSGSPIDADDHLGDGDQLRAIGTIFAHALRNLDAYEPVERDLRALDVPVFVGWGDRDPFFGVEQAQRTAAAARDARLAIYEGAGHFLPAERPAEVAADVRRLVAEAAAGPTGVTTAAG